MAYAKGVGLSGIVGLIGAAAAGYYGYKQAEVTEGVEPIMGAMIYGGGAFILGSVGAFLLRSALQFVVYAVVLAGAIYIFRDQIEAMTGIDPVAFTKSALERARDALPDSG